MVLKCMTEAARTCPSGITPFLCFLSPAHNSSAVKGAEGAWCRWRGGAEGFWGRWDGGELVQKGSGAGGGPDGGGGLQGAARVSDTFRNFQIWKFMKVIKTP